MFLYKSCLSAKGSQWLDFCCVTYTCTHTHTHTTAGGNLGLWNLCVCTEEQYVVIIMQSWTAILNPPLFNKPLRWITENRPRWTHDRGVGGWGGGVSFSLSNHIPSLRPNLRTQQSASKSFTVTTLAVKYKLKCIIICVGFLFFNKQIYQKCGNGLPKKTNQKIPKTPKQITWMDESLPWLNRFSPTVDTS